MEEKVCLICLDGWGISLNEDPAGDAIRNANTPVMDKLKDEYPHTTLEAYGLAVGLPEGLMGNSEVGHLNIGAGRVVYQDIVRIDLAVKNKKFNEVENIVKCFDRAKETNGRIHFLGLVSDGGVHSHINHLIHLLETAKNHGIPNAYVHFFGDGRDTNPRSSDKYLEQLQKAIDDLSYGKVATIIGRYYAMDRDKRWERVKIAFEALTKGVGEKSQDPLSTIHERFSKDETDEFLKPIIVDEEGIIKENDTLFFFDFRSDRMRQIVQTFGIPPPPFETEVPDNLHITCMTRYKTEFPFSVAFPPQTMDNVLAEWLAKHKVPQCHVAETEKYAHVTFFFNGGVEKQFELEHRDLISSPKVATYDLKPEMSAIEVAEKVAEEIKSGEFPFVMNNFANPDMVGHTGVYDAAVKAIETTDKAIGIIYEACKAEGYILFITSDHGNAEQMQDEKGNPHTAHTCNPVPFIMTSKKYSFTESAKGSLCDVAPTILEVMGLEIPKEMTGLSLLKK
ncbi:2,3-bisphosphoglycerate-independent phosphoglycerate mutase [Glomus cerebriforme]|uniref:2,3-bisphosphoglycerate-independent phosphoglycerate mutase n=1 Tax=Glomus cerebriforme TaxID=658196 RepID=A0A397TJM0_9GLOM|nr:2,3-bisphosphoglycerate-independent phosphoglycerate mutase [Glomus cerebriforme]